MQVYRKSFARKLHWVFKCPKCSRLLGFESPYRVAIGTHDIILGTRNDTLNAPAWKDTNRYALEDALTTHISKCYPDYQRLYWKDRNKLERSFKAWTVKAKGCYDDKNKYTWSFDV